ncbi:MGMT family protein [Thermosphaera sp.]
MLVITVNNKNVEINPARFDDVCEAVWILTSLIPVGKVSSYGEIGRMLRVHPRLVANCLSRNRYPLIIPCHRVVYKDGRLGGYSDGGAMVKARLLQVEGALRGDENRVPVDAFIRLDEFFKSKR